MPPFNKSELAEIFAVTRNTISNWVIAGAPCIKQGRPGLEAQFEIEQVLRWRKGKLDQLRHSNFFDEGTGDFIALVVKEVRERARAVIRRRKVAR